MKYYMKRSMAALLMMGAMFVACTEEEEVQDFLQEDTPETYTLTVEATKGDDTRALSLAGTTLNATWTAGEKVKVYLAYIAFGNTEQWLDPPVEIGYLTAQSSGKSTTLTGEVQTSYKMAGNVSIPIQPGWKVLLKFDGSIGDDGSGIPAQDGTLETLANYYDIATATVDLTGVSGNTITTSPANFENQQAIVRFTLKDKADETGNTPVNVTQLTVCDDTNTITINPATATNEFYVALPGFDNKTVYITATNGTNEYVYERNGVSFESGSFYDVKVKLNTSQKALPLTLKAEEDGTLSFRNKAGNPVTYRINGGVRNTIPSEETGEINVSTGDKVAFFGDNTKYGDAPKASSSNFSGINFIAYGNIMSLISSTDYYTSTTLTGSYAFSFLFSGSGIVILDMPTLYLPAKTLKESCYESMFQDCTRLTSAPSLPATELASSCYESMFRGCTALKSSPRLPAESLSSTADYCYSHMFYGCTSLRTAKAIDAQFTGHHSSSNVSYCSHMFAYCTSLKATPVIQISTLYKGCCRYMFAYCSSLSKVTVKSGTVKNGSTENWLFGVADSGTFITNYSSIWTQNSASGIPKGWTISN